MGKGHRDNRVARKKRGPSASALRAKRSEAPSKCNLCGTPCRPKKLEAGLCPYCINKKR